jgi:hypothetical protein
LHETGRGFAKGRLNYTAIRTSTNGYPKQRRLDYHFNRHFAKPYVSCRHLNLIRFRLPSAMPTDCN